MTFRRILITGGAGFVGSNLAIKLKSAFAGVDVIALDNLVRRGSELALPRLREAGVTFMHGDIRCPEDLEQAGAFDLLLDCSAEPSVQAGTSGSPMYVLNTNLAGTLNCAEAARRRGAAFLFLSTSRVYPMQPLNEIPVRETKTRFEWILDGSMPGLTDCGVTEQFPLEGARSYYGASKLAAEIILQEFAFNHGMPLLINRCGVIAGPWQMGKVDQGVVTLWVARHVYKQPLNYIGFGGSGKQVRDILHIDDIFDLLLAQIEGVSSWNGAIYNVGGGREVSVSLMELTDFCRDATGNTIEIGSVAETSDVDVRIYLTDTSKVETAYKWRSQRAPEAIVEDISRWIADHRKALRPVLAGE